MQRKKQKTERKDLGLRCVRVWDRGYNAVAGVFKDDLLQVRVGKNVVRCLDAKKYALEFFFSLRGVNGGTR